MYVNMLATLLTPLYLCLFVFICGWGLNGAAAAWNLVQLSSLAMLVGYIAVHNRRQKPGERTWTGWTLEAFFEWGTYIQVSIGILEIGIGIGLALALALQDWNWKLALGLGFVL